MTLTMGRAPFAPKETGCFNFERQGPQQTLYWEDFPKRVRTEFGGETIADSRRVKALFETGRMMVFYFPREDIAMDRLERTDRHTQCPLKGEASYWTVRAGDREAENAAWSYEAPIASAPFIAGYIAFDYDAMGAWYQELDRIFAHPRDPFYRYDIHETDQQVTIWLEDICIGRSGGALVLFETSLPPRFYLPPEAVRTDLLSRSRTVTQCPYKGEARHWHINVQDKRIEDAAWSYPRPLGEAERIRDWFSFYPSKLRVEVDGKQLGRE